MKRLHKALLMPWAGGDSSMAYTNKIIALGPIAYWPMAEASGSVALDASGNGRNGAYTGVTLGNTGIGDGRTAAGFDGATAYNNIYSASLAGAFNNAEGSIVCWAQVASAGVWTDGASRRMMFLGTDASNRILLQKQVANNTLLLEYTAGGAAKQVTTTLLTGVTIWFHLAITWSKTADQMKTYVNGVVTNTLTALGTWVGALSSGSALIGATTTTPTNVWNGLEAHAALFARALTPAEVLAAATL